MTDFEKIRGEHLRAYHEFLMASNDYKARPNAEIYKAALDKYKKEQKKYFAAIELVRRDILMQEFRSAAMYEQQANDEYLPFIATASTNESINPTVIEGHILFAATDKKLLTREWVRHLTKLLI